MPDRPHTGEEAQVQRTWKPITAGILSIIAGVINFTHGALSLTLGGFVTFMAPAESAGLLHVVGIIAAVLMVLGATSIAGGVYALMRRLWGLALAGACCAVLCTIPLLFGIPAIVFLAKGKAEFARASDTDPKSRADAESS